MWGLSVKLTYFYFRPPSAKAYGVGRFTPLRFATGQADFRFLVYLATTFLENQSRKLSGLLICLLVIIKDAY